MRSRVLLVGALHTSVGACGGHVSDPESARCPSPPATFVKRVVLADHAELAVRYTCEGASIGGTVYTIHVYPEANHGLFDSPPTDPRALPDTLAWLRGHT